MLFLKNKLFKYVFFFLCCSSFFSAEVFSNEKLKQEKLASAQKSLKASFNKLTVIDFKETEIPDLYEIDLGSGTIYYHAVTEWLIFGEIWNKEGKNLTIESRLRSAKENMKKLPMNSGLVFGDKDGVEIIEFTDPDCPYCRSYERFLSSIKGSYKIKRRIFFDTRIHPDAINKVVHIICSDDQEKAYKEIYSGVIPESFMTCEKAESVISNHKTVAESIGVSGTPSFILNGEVVTGFKKSKITNFLNSKK